MDVDLRPLYCWSLIPSAFLHNRRLTKNVVNASGNFHSGKGYFLTFAEIINYSHSMTAISLHGFTFPSQFFSSAGEGTGCNGAHVLAVLSCNWQASL